MGSGESCNHSCPMTTWTRTALLTTLAVAVTTLPAVTFAPRAEAAGVPPLAWTPCESPGGPTGQECAGLPVPLDYRDPRGPRLTLAVTRLRSDGPEARQGTLLALPGGPGGSGVQRLTQRGAALRAQTEGRYDIVGFDPRGVGASTRASCGITEGDRYVFTLRSWPAPDGSIDENAARSRRVAEACARNGGAVVRSFSTANQVRDMDRLRRALGEEKISAWATSYGAYAGAVYAQKYPQHTGRLVLDSVGDPDPRRVERQWLANMAEGAEDRFPDFAAWAADPPSGHRDLQLAERPEEVEPLVLALAAKLDRTPRQSHVPGLPLTGSMLRQALQNALYGDALFPSFAALVKAAADPLGEPPVLPAELSAPVPDADASVIIAVLCNDVSWPRTVGHYRRTVAEARAAHPLTAGMTANIVPCAFWKDAPADEPTRMAPDGPSNILVIQGLRDPATPLSGALRMRAALGDRARMVTVGRGGHGMYVPRREGCGDRTVEAFLNHGQRPRHDVHCED
ncbi:hypothetical protein GCM10010392_62580 [Streptomyces clavifer]|nr:hypothetical protein GCM10010392_62580 [Streptomyces clavifer]